MQYNICMHQDGGCHPKKLIKKVNTHHPTFTSVGMATIMKPEIPVEQIPERTELLYRPSNERILEVHLRKDQYRRPSDSSPAKQESSSHHEEPHYSQGQYQSSDGLSLSRALNAPTTLMIKQKQSAGYNIISNS